MIKILIVDDNPSKQSRIKETILNNHNIKETELIIANSVKSARKFLYDNIFDLMILDLVLPVEDNGECDAQNSISFLNEIGISPSINPPIHIVGLSGFKEEVIEHNTAFKDKLWNLIDYEENSFSWQDQLNSIIYHLVKTRLNFLGSSIGDQLNLYFSELEKLNMPNPFLGSTWEEIGSNIITILERTLLIPSKFKNGLKAKNINNESIKISSEYDFQNLIHIALRPWLPSIEAENIAVIYDGNTKYADFSIKGNSIIIEAKYIDTTGKKNDVLKTLEGLKHFYKNNANVKLLLFIILVNSNVQIDVHKIESDFSSSIKEPIIKIKLLENILDK